MGIIYSEIYKKYFPVKYRFTEFTDQEKVTLCRWAHTLEVDVAAHEAQQVKHGVRRFLTYDLTKFNKDAFINMIMKNQFDEQGLIAINSIIYSHKYNFLLSIFLFPILTKERYTRLMN